MCYILRLLICFDSWSICCFVWGFGGGGGAGSGGCGGGDNGFIICCWGFCCGCVSIIGLWNGGDRDVVAAIRNVSATRNVSDSKKWVADNWAMNELRFSMFCSIVGLITADMADVVGVVSGDWRIWGWGIWGWGIWGWGTFWF